MAETASSKGKTHGRTVLDKTAGPISTTRNVTPSVQQQNASTITLTVEVEENAAATQSTQSTAWTIMEMAAVIKDATLRNVDGMASTVSEARMENN